VQRCKLSFIWVFQQLIVVEYINLVSPQCDSDNEFRMKQTFSNVVFPKRCRRGRIVGVNPGNNRIYPNGMGVELLQDS